MDRWCCLLGQIITAKHADQLLKTGRFPAGTGVVVLPSFLWRVPEADVGRKSRASDGGRLLLPVRIDWVDGPVAIARPGEVLTRRWTANGLGIALCGETRLPLDDDRWGSTVGDPFDPEEPPSRYGIRVDCEGPRQHLEELVRAGLEAELVAMMMIEPEVESEIRNAHSFLVQDMIGDQDADLNGLILLDEADLQVCRDLILLGTTTCRSAVGRLLEKSTEPNAFVNVDPQKFARTFLHSRVQHAVRQAVGDPQQGSKIRRVARELGVTSPERGGAEQILCHYRNLYPRDEMGVDRVRQALSIRPFRWVSTVHDWPSEIAV